MKLNRKLKKYIHWSFTSLPYTMII